MNMQCTCNNFEVIVKKNTCSEKLNVKFVFMVHLCLKYYSNYSFDIISTLFKFSLSVTLTITKQIRA
jgi:hypothetical protein